MSYLLNAILVVLYGLLLKLVVADVNKRKLFFFILSTTHLGLFHGLRNPYLYPDNDYYARAYQNIGDYSFVESISFSPQYPIMGEGYIFYNWILNHISHDPVFFFFVTSIITVTGTTWFIYKWSYEPVWSTFFYLLSPSLFDQSLFVLRQHLASVMILMALLYIRNKKISISISLLAVLFHMSAVIFLPFYLFYSKTKWPFTSRQIFNWACAIFVIFNIGRVIFLQYYVRYAEYQEHNLNSLPVILVGSVFLAHYLNGSYRSKEIEEIPQLKYLAYSTFILVGLMGTPGAARMSSHFIYIVTVSFPLLFKYNNIKIIYQKKVLFSIGYTCLVLVLWLLVYFSGGFVEYKMITSVH